MHVEVKRVGIASLVKVSFVIYAAFGIIVGLIYVFVAVVLGSLFDYSEMFEGTKMFRLAATGLGILLVPLFAVFYGCLGALGSLVFGLVYNLVAKGVGGIRLKLDGEGLTASGDGVGGDSDRQPDVRL